MNVLDIFIGIAVFLVFIIFFPDIFPRCACCQKLKFRPLFKLHKTVRVSLGYSAYRSVCRKCSSKYSIETLSDLDRVKSIRRRVEVNAGTSFAFPESGYKSSVRKKI